MRNIFLSIPAVLATACVLSPTDGDTLTSQHDLLDFTGGAAAAGNAISVEAWNHTTGEFESVGGTTTSSSRLSSEPDMFRWSVPGVDLADRHWVLPGADCTSSGIARLRVLEQRGTQRVQLFTFDAGGQACLAEEIGDGTHPVGAGNICRTGEQIVLHAPPRCVRVPSSDLTGPFAALRASQGASIWKTDSSRSSRVTGTASASSAISLRASGRDLDSGVRVASLSGTATVTCVRGAESTTVDSPLAARVNGPWRRGELAETGLDASLTVVPSSFRSSCATGFTATSLRLTASAFTENNDHGIVAGDRVAITPTLQLTINLR
jgi:hypothetical protein